MFPTDELVNLSRFQFALTALFHFLFVPLTLGLTWILVIMESVYVKTGNVIYKDMTQFWSKLLAINFAMGVLTGITLEFEFGQNWAYFSRMIGGSFAPVLAVEGITAFMLEATMFGLFFFSWNKVGKKAHLGITFLMALGASLSIVNILAANSWMQKPTATTFNYQNMSLELHSIIALYLNSLAQIRISHVAFGGFLTGSIFVMGVSAFYILVGRDIEFAKRSFAVGVGFGLICALAVAFYGDQNGLQVAKYEPEKMAAIEAQWQTQKPPASWSLIAFPSQKEQKNYFVISIPYALSLIATHSLKGVVPGALELMKGYKQRIENGMLAYGAMRKMLEAKATPQDRSLYNRYKNDLGFGFLLDRYNPRVVNSTPAEIEAATRDTIPNMAIAFWSFRFMFGLWGLMLLLLIFGFFYCYRNTLTQHRLFLRCALYAIPLPFLAAEFGWILAESGRQPWSVHEILPTFMSVSTISVSTVMTSLLGYIAFYSSLFVIELFLMFKYARRGPSSLETGRYYFER
ncbi:cytochrome ubiquinol oxidase subunit I [Coxiella burnetii]|uniref:cytochrome ubiquinol oxidase subunit I n=1 Tax=Coxiella burnetii TaxID=777 RepID=UPI000183D0DE|nr:cytochrome ubiquinol oxidase subunit I [Coxiella burnetii]ACJ19059.1 cytochrome d ubiquinol oxidase subunit I [Coxiella burnetii CbuG_Q212]ATN67412.1 cytochrome d terminal oxidase subunit 1 [Coxiella burnetii]OYK85598.1 cytochrome d terminal oxidase subunit 1 [Coxiella burnetii]